MAGADYYLCDGCGCKTFYDAELHYEPYGCSDRNENPRTHHPWPCPKDRVGFMFVVCPACAATLSPHINRLQDAAIDAARSKEKHDD